MPIVIRQKKRDENCKKLRMTEWTDNALFDTMKKLAEWAESDPVDFTTQSILYLLPFMLVAFCLTWKLNQMITTLKDEQRQLDKMKKVTKND